MDRKLFDISKIDQILWMGYIALIVEIIISFYLGIVPYLRLSNLDIYDTLLILTIFIPLIIVLLWSFIYLFKMAILQRKSMLLIKRYLAIIYLLTSFTFLSLTFMFQPHYFSKSDYKLGIEMHNIIGNPLINPTNQALSQTKLSV